MRIFNLFNKKTKAQGILAYFNLQDWWLSELSVEDRDLIQKKYQPMGSISLTEGEVRSTSQTPIKLLSGMVSWFSGPKERHIAYKLIAKAESLIDESSKPLDIHFLYGSKIEITYKDRDDPKYGITKAIEACQQQIAFSEKAANVFLAQYKNQPLPSHKGYQQLAIVFEKQKQYEAVIQLCNQAKSQGWAGDWDKRIERTSKKLKS